MIKSKNDIEYLMSLMDAIRDVRNEFYRCDSAERAEIHERLYTLYTQINPKAYKECLFSLLEVLEAYEYKRSA